MITKNKFILMLAFVLFGTNTLAGSFHSCQDAKCKDYFKAFERRAKEGKVQAIATLAEFYYQGYGVEKNDKLALKYYRKAANRGASRAQYKLGMMYILGEAGTHDVDKGIALLTKSVKLYSTGGNKNAAYILGLIYYSDKFGKQDFAKADIWLAEAYSNHHYGIPEVIGYMRSLNNFTDINFPQLSAAIAKRPLVTNAKGKLSWFKDDMEVVTIQGVSLETRLDKQLVSLRSRRVTVGTRLQSRSCAETPACLAYSRYDLFGSGLVAWSPFM